MIAIVGDRNPHYLTHEATDVALSQLGAEARWVSTPTLLQDPGRLSEYAGALIAPGSPYLSTEGALAAIRYARELGLPLLGTCGGFQHVILEFARDVAGMTGADHAELNADADVLVVVPLSAAWSDSNTRSRSGPARSRVTSTRRPSWSSPSSAASG